MCFEVLVRTLLSFQEFTFTILGDLEGICGQWTRDTWKLRWE